MNTQPFSQTGKMIELCCEYLSVRCNWLYVIIMSSTRFRVNLHSIVAWISRNSLLQQGVPWHSECRFTLKGIRDQLASLAKWLSVYLQTKWLQVPTPLLPFKFQISCLFWARSSLTFRQLHRVDSLWNAYVTWQ